MIDKIKKVFRAIISFLFGVQAEGISARDDVLSAPLAMADDLCEHLKNHRHASTEQTVESVSMHRFAVLLRRKLYSMRRTCEASMFNAMYHDSVMFAGGIADNKVIDITSRELAKSVFESLVRLSATNESADGVAIYEVVFGGKGRRYCYTGRSKAFEAGQYVCVPVGEEGEILVVRIVSVSDIDRYTGDYPIDKMKPILSNAFLSVVVTEAMGKNNC